VSEAELRNRLLQDPVPGEQEAGQRTWEVLCAVYANRDRIPWIERHSRFVVVLAVAAALVVAGVSPPGQAVVEHVRDEVAARTQSEPALVRLPARGRLLVVSGSGPWVVQQDGSKRLLGDYDDASWSPRGLFVVATEGERLVTVEPESGDVRWSLSRTEPIRGPRWSGGGPDTRIAYRTGSALHVVAGDGSPDALLANDVAPVAPAWKTNSHVLAYASSRDGRVHVVDVDVRRELWTTPRIAGLRRITFSPDGFLVVLTSRNAGLYGRRGLVRLAAESALPKGHLLLDASPLPGGRVLYADYDPKADATALVLAHCFAPGPCLLVGPSEVFRGAGQIGNLTLSPDGRWLGAAWPAADQILFSRILRFDKVVLVSNIRREFESGPSAPREFPRMAGWVEDAAS
jgi:hypothetical protein